MNNKPNSCKFGTLIHNGYPVHYFQCICDPDVAAERMALAQMEEYRLEHEHDLIRLHDPNRVDGSRSRWMETDEDGNTHRFIHLGRRASRVPSRCRRI